MVDGGSLANLLKGKSCHDFRIAVGIKTIGAVLSKLAIADITNIIIVVLASFDLD